MENEMPKRKKNRLENYDYSSCGAYFITICTENRRQILSPPTKRPVTVASFVSTFKRFCNKEIGENIWQRNYYDHIIRNREDYENHSQYITENPMHWAYDELYSYE